MAASAREDGRKQRRYPRRESQRRAQRAKTGQTYTESQQSTAGQAIGLAERFVGWISLLDGSQQEESSMSTSHGSSAVCGIAASLIG
jgi:hypothetical protein